MKRVVVAIDHSAVSRSLMDYAFNYAVREKDVILYFLNVVEPERTGWRSRSREVDEVLLAKVRKEVHDWVHGAAAEFGQAIPDLRVAVRPGLPAEVILDFAEGVAADLIMIGHRGNLERKRFVLGSVAAEVVAHANCSVYVHRPRVLGE
jgi:nucleotide-binding universal stress UspA family protein